MNEKWVVDASSLIVLGKKCAKTFSIKVKGTLAIIMMAKKEELITDVKPILDQMIEVGFRIKSNLYQKILEIVNE